MFIVFEGADGSGKTTQSRALAEGLKADPDLNGREIVHTREPGGTTGAEDIRALLMSGDSGKWSPETELLLFNAARRDHVEKVIRPALDRGAVVICDRFVGSTIAYQGARSPDLARKAKRVHDVMIGLNPDLTILLDRPRGVAEASVSARGKDRMEEVQGAFMSRTRREFGRMLRSDPSWVGVFAGERDVVKSVVSRAVRSRLGIGEGLRTRAVLDEDYLLSMADLRIIGEQAAPDLFSNGLIETRASFGDTQDLNPYDAMLSITTSRDGASGGAFMSLSGVPVSFEDLSQEEAETVILERIESDLPDMMARMNGQPTEDETFGPGC